MVYPILSRRVSLSPSLNYEFAVVVYTVETFSLSLSALRSKSHSPLSIFLFFFYCINLYEIIDIKLVIQFYCILYFAEFK